MVAASVAAACLAWLALLLAPTAAAQSTEALAAARARAKQGATTTIDQPGARLFVPVGAVVEGAVISFGLGGVPDRDGRTGRPGAIVTAAGGLIEPAVVLFRPALAAGAPGAGPYALLDTASGERTACQADAAWVACIVPRAGAYLLDRGPPAAGTDPLLRAALEQPPGDASGQPKRGRVIQAALVIAVAAGLGGAVAWFAGRRARS